jgi:hypothetical protein
MIDGRSRSNPAAPFSSARGQTLKSVEPNRRDGPFLLPGARGPAAHLSGALLHNQGGSGTGLGLVISHRIVVERHQGKIDFSTGQDGTQFNVRLPFESPGHA